MNSSALAEIQAALLAAALDNEKAQIEGNTKAQEEAKNDTLVVPDVLPWSGF